MKENSKKLIILLIITGLLIIMSNLSVQAASATADLKTDKEKVKPGESFTITLTASSEQGLNGITGKLSYDKEKLELQKVEIAKDWIDMSGGNREKIELMYNSVNTVKTAEVYKITFIVKEGAAEQVKINVEELKISTMASGEDDTVTIGNKEIGINISDKQEEKLLTSIEITNLPTKTTYTEGEKFNTAGMKVTAKYSDGTSKEITNYTFSPNATLKTTDKEIIISYTEGEVTKTVSQSITVSKKSETPQDNNDNKNEQKNNDKSNGNSQKDTNNNANNGNSQKDGTTAKGTYPKTGAEKIILPIIVLVAISIGTYFAYKKNKF